MIDAFYASKANWTPKKTFLMQIFELGRDVTDTDTAVKTCGCRLGELSNATQLWALKNGFSRTSFGASDQFDNVKHARRVSLWQRNFSLSDKAWYNRRNLLNLLHKPFFFF